MAGLFAYTCRVMEKGPFVWSDLKGPRLYLLSVDLSSADRQIHNLPTNRPEIWSPARILCATCTIC